MRFHSAAMARSYLILVMLLMTAANVIAQPEASASTFGWGSGHGGFIPRPISLQCQPLPTLSGNSSQTWRLECWSGNIPAGGTAQGFFNWANGMTSATTIQSVQMELVDQPGRTAEGTDFLSLSGSFIASSWILPSCSSRQSFSLGDGQTATTTLSWPRSWRGHRAASTTQGQGEVSASHFRSRRPIDFGCSGMFRAMSPVEGPAPGDISTATFGWWSRPVVPTPSGLRMQLSCSRGSAGGSCSVIVRLAVQFANNALASTMNVYEKQARAMETREKWNAEIRSWVDTDGILGDKGKRIDTEVCFPRAPGNGSQDGTYRPPRRGGRNLLQQAQTLDMAPVYPYNQTIITKATRLARYASAIHGCLPSTPSNPQTYTAADGSRQLRQWDGPTGMSNWGGPQPGPECRSCFKDGISFAPGAAPRGFQTREFSTSDTESFFDAAITFTDSAISGVAGRSAVVVLFRATATAVQASQWLSNVGYCVVASGGQIPPTTNPASGTVCDGWDRPVTDLMALGLMDDVLRKLNALPPADRVVYVTGHSRGGALAAVFAAKLLALQASGGLPAYSGDRADQIKLYTFGAPRVGSTVFAAYLEDNMRERYRIVNRYDGVPTAPSSGYSHFRPSIWYRDSSGNLTPSPRRACVLLDQNQLTEPQEACFISCNSVLTCSYGAGVNIPGQPDPPSSFFTTRQECTDLSDAGNAGLSAATLAPGSTTLIDHGSYLGIDVNNDGCRADLAILNAFTPVPGTFFGFNCRPNTN